MRPFLLQASLFLLLLCNKKFMKLYCKFLSVLKKFSRIYFRNFSSVKSSAKAQKIFRWLGTVSSLLCVGEIEVVVRITWSREVKTCVCFKIWQTHYSMHLILIRCSVFGCLLSLQFIVFYLIQVYVTTTHLSPCISSNWLLQLAVLFICLYHLITAVSQSLLDQQSTPLDTDSITAIRWNNRSPFSACQSWFWMMLEYFKCP